jgi:diguanylate cyclase (GGDEF)-like protein
VLKRELGPLGFFIARIGGDEFVTVAEMGNIADANAIRPKIEKALEAESEKLAYKISVSIGFAERMGENDTIQDLFKRADQELYKVKSVRHGKG